MPNVKPMRMHAGGWGPRPGKTVRVIGTGAVNRLGTVFQPRPKQATLKTVSYRECSRSYGGIVQKTMMCAVGSGADACYGDRYDRVIFASTECVLMKF